MNIILSKNIFSYCTQRKGYKCIRSIYRVIDGFNLRAFFYGTDMVSRVISRFVAQMPKL